MTKKKKKKSRIKKPTDSLSVQQTLKLKCLSDILKQHKYADAGEFNLEQVRTMCYSPT